MVGVLGVARDALSRYPFTVGAIEILSDAHDRAVRAAQIVTTRAIAAIAVTNRPDRNAR